MFKVDGREVYENQLTFFSVFFRNSFLMQQIKMFHN